MRVKTKIKIQNKYKGTGKIVKHFSKSKINKTIGKILIIIEKEETVNVVKGEYLIEVEITSPEGKRFTVVRETFTVTEDLIKWENK